MGEKIVGKLKDFHGEKGKFYILLCFKVEAFIVMVSPVSCIFLISYIFKKFIN